MKQTVNVQRSTLNTQLGNYPELDVGRSPRRSPSTAKAGWTLSVEHVPSPKK
jgi:hypothetical protein